MISVTATLIPGCTAALELATVEQVVRYVRDHAGQAERWEIIGTPEEESAIAAGLGWHASGIETAKPLGREAGPVRKGESPAPHSGETPTTSGPPVPRWEG